MKRTQVIGAIVGVGIVIGLAYLVFTQHNVEEYVKPQIVTEEVEVIISELDKRIQSEQEAIRAEAESLAQEAYDERFEQAMKEAELRVTAEYKAEIEAKELELEKEMGVY